MRTIRKSSPRAMIATCLMLAGCAGGPSLPPPGTTSANTPLTLIDPLGDEAATGLTGSILVPDSLVAVYSRVARGLNRCWLRDGRALGLTYVLHAKIDPEPASTGTMTIHLRSPTGRRGLKAFNVDLSTIGQQTRVLTTNLKLLPQQSKSVTKDVTRWAIGGTECAGATADIPAPQRKPGHAKPRSRPF